MSDFEPYPVERPAAEPPRVARPGHLIGRATSVQTRQEQRGEHQTRTVLSIRLEAGSPARPVDLELRGATISGSVHVGDWVEFSTTGDQKGSYAVRELANLTTGARVEADAALRTPQARVARVVFLLFFLAALVFIAVTAFQIFGRSW